MIDKEKTHCCLGIGFCVQLGQIFGLVGGNLGLALLQCQLGLVPPLLGDLLLRLLLVRGVLADRLMSLLVDIFNIVGANSELDVAAELAFVGLFILLLQVTHVVGDVQPKDVGTVHLGIEVLLLGIVAGETLDGVRNVETSVDGTFHGAKDTSTGGGARQSDVQVAPERCGPVINVLDQVLFTGDVRAAGIQRLHAQLVEDAACDQQTGAVGGGIVGQTHLDSVTGQLMGVGGAHDTIALNAGVSNLASDVAIAETDNQAVLGRVILVLVLEDQAFACLVVGFTLTTPLELDLVPLEVLLVLYNFNESHFYG